MTALDLVTDHLERVKACRRDEIHEHISPALTALRFLPAPERRACADLFFRWADAHADEPVKKSYALFLQAVDRFISEEHAAALQLLLAARSGFVEAREPDGIALTAMLIGAVYRTLGYYDLALKILWEALEMLKASGRYPGFRAAAANSVANIDLELGNLAEALTMFNVAHEESTRADDFYFMIYALHGLARVYVHQERRAEAEEMFQRALRLAESHANPMQISNSLTELATFEYNTGRLDESETLSTRALAIREEHHLLGGAVTNLIRLADIHCRREEWSAALSVLTRALAIATEVQVKPKIAQVHQMLSHAYEKTGEFDQSLTHYKRYHELREQVEREDSARKVADARLVFDAEQTRKENVVIRSQKEEIERQNRELQTTIDELTRARIGRKARTYTLALAVVLFIFQDAILGAALTWLRSDNYFLLLGVKMAIIFSLSPINRAIERHLLRRVARSDPTVAAT